MAALSTATVHHAMPPGALKTVAQLALFSLMTYEEALQQQPPAATRSRFSMAHVL